MATKTYGYETITWSNSDQSDWAPLQKKQYKAMKKNIASLPKSNVVESGMNMISVSKKNARDFISVNAVLDELKNVGDDYYLLMKMQLHTGARIGDLSSLKLKEINFEKGLIYIERGKGEGGSGKKKRIVPMSKTMKKDLQELVKLKKLKPNSLLFPSPTDTAKPVSDNVVLARLNKVLEKRGPDGEALFDYKAWNREKTHKFRKAWATMAIQAGLDSKYVQEILGHKDDLMKVFYAADALDPNSNIVKQFDILAEQADILDTHLDFQRQFYEYDRTYQKHKEITPNIKLIDKKKQIVNKKIVEQNIKQIDLKSDEEISKFTKTSRYKQSGKSFNQKFAPSVDILPVDAQVDRLRQIELGVSTDKLDIKVPKGTKEPTIGDFPDYSTKEKIDRARMGDWKTAPIAQAVFDKKQTDAIDSMYDKESETKIKKNIILDENNATRAVAESIDALDFNRYNGNVKTMLKNVLDEASIYKYNPGDMLDWDSSSWDNNSKGLSEIFSGTKYLGNKGAELKLDSKVVNDIFLNLEEVSRFDYLTKRIVDQLDYLQYPPNVAASGAERFKYQKVMIEDALDNFLKTNQGEKFSVGYSNLLGKDLNIREIVDRIAVSIQPIGDSKDFSHISKDYLKSVIENNPEAFPEVSDKLKRIYPEEVLNRMRLEPYLQFFNEQDLIDDVVYFSEKELLKDGDLSTPLKEKIKFKADGTVDLRTSTPFVPEIRSTGFNQVFQAAYPDPDQTVIAKGIERTAKRSAVIFNDIEDVEDTTEGDFKQNIKGGYKPTNEHKYIKLLKTGLKTFGKGAAFIIPFYGTGARAGAIGVEAALEVGTRTYFADMSSIGEDVLNKELLPTDELGFTPSADPEETITFLENESPETVAKLINKTEAPEKEVTTGEVYKEKFKDIGRSLVAGSAFGTGDPDFFAGTVKELSDAELAGAGPDIARRTSDEEISKFVPEQEATLDRRRTNFANILKKFPGAKGDPEKQIRNPRLEDIQENLVSEDTDNQMAGLGLTSQPQGEENATNR